MIVVFATRMCGKLMEEVEALSAESRRGSREHCSVSMMCTGICDQNHMKVVQIRGFRNNKQLRRFFVCNQEAAFESKHPYFRRQTARFSR